MNRFILGGAGGLAAVALVVLAARAQDGGPIPTSPPPGPADVAGGAPSGPLTISDRFAPAPQRGMRRRVSPEEEAAAKKMAELVGKDRQLSAQIVELARIYKDLKNDGERAEAAKQLAAFVTGQFEIRQALRGRELGELEAQVARLRALHSERASQQDRIVRDRVQQLLRDAEGLGWGELEAPSGGYGGGRGYGGYGGGYGGRGYGWEAGGFDGQIDLDLKLESGAKAWNPAPARAVVIDVQRAKAAAERARRDAERSVRDQAREVRLQEQQLRTQQPELFEQADADREYSEQKIEPIASPDR